MNVLLELVFTELKIINYVPVHSLRINRLPGNMSAFNNFGLMDTKTTLPFTLEVGYSQIRLFISPSKIEQ